MNSRKLKKTNILTFIVVILLILTVSISGVLLMFWSSVFKNSDKAFKASIKKDMPINLQIKKIGDSATYIENEYIDSSLLIYKVEKNRFLSPGCQETGFEINSEKSNCYLSATDTLLNYCAGAVKIDANVLENYNLKMLHGRLPEAEDEIVINNFIFQLYMKYGIYWNKFEAKPLSSWESLKGNEILDNYKVVGVIDTGLELDDFINAKSFDEARINLEKTIVANRFSEIHKLIFVTLDFVEAKQTIGSIVHIEDEKTLNSLVDRINAAFEKGEEVVVFASNYQKSEGILKSSEVINRLKAPFSIYICSLIILVALVILLAIKKDVKFIKQLLLVMLIASMIAIIVTVSIVFIVDYASNGKADYCITRGEINSSSVVSILALVIGSLVFAIVPLFVKLGTKRSKE